MLILNGPAIAGHHLARVRSNVQIDVRFRPARMVKERGHEIPVHKEILVVVAAALCGADSVAYMFGIGREIASVILEVVRLESDGTVVEVGVVLKQTPAIDKHRVGPVGMSLYEPSCHIRSHFDTVQDTLHTQ